MLSFDPGTFITTVNVKGKGSVFRDQEVIHYNVQLPMQVVYPDAIISMYLDGEPCILVVGCVEGAGVYFWHAVTLCEVRSLPLFKKTCTVFALTALGLRPFLEPIQVGLESDHLV